jgi:3-isopropylmalate/(R)-2-methylmalate dehydratase large subunit
MAQTITEKILARASGEREVHPGDIVTARVDVAMMHDSLGALALNQFKRLSAEEVWDPSRIVIVFDHRSPATNIDSARSQAALRRFAREQGIRGFYDVGRGGICHQVLHEEGHVRPGDVIVGTDSHTTTHGALGAFAAGIGATEMAGVLATGELWFRVPETVMVDLEGDVPRGVVAKDVILHVLGLMGAEGASYRAVEFEGPAAREMSVEGRLTLCNMSAEMGAKNAVIEPDVATLNYLSGRAKGEMRPVASDHDAEYCDVRTVDCSGLEPLVAAPSSPDNVVTVGEVEGVEVDQAFLGSCTNGRMEDLRAAAEILRGRRISDSVRLIVIPASQRIWAQAGEEGILRVLQGAGASVCTPSCGPCTGADKGILGPGEVCVSTTNRNFVGRMGDPTSKVYLASPYTVAASALTGRITDPRPYLEEEG